MSDLASDGLSTDDHRGSLTQTTARADNRSTAELSFAEELMWRAELDGPNALPFFDCARCLWLVLRLQGPLNHDALKSSLDAVVQRHAVLRSSFIAANGKLVRLTSQGPSFSFTTFDRQNLSPEDPREIVENEIKPQLERLIDLARGQLFRSALVVLGSHDHILAIAVHHIVFDRWSKRLLESELSRFYCACVIGMEIGDSPLPLQYQDYVSWQREQLNSERTRKLSKYWTDKLCGLPELILPRDGECGPMISTRSGTSWFTIPEEEVSRLVVLSRRSRTTLAATMLAIFILFLSKLCDVDDVAVGVPLSDRCRPEFEELIGLFMNVVVVRTSIPKGTFLELLDRVRRTLVEACSRQDLPYGYLQRIIPARTPYRVVFNFMPALSGSDIEWAGLQKTFLPSATELQSLADLSLLVRHQAGRLICRVIYKADLFSDNRGQSFATQIHTLAKAVLQTPQSCITCLHLE